MTKKISYKSIEDTVLAWYISLNNKKEHGSVQSNPSPDQPEFQNYM